MGFVVAGLCFVVGGVIGAYSESKDCYYCGHHGNSRWFFPVCEACLRRHDSL